MKTGVSHIRCKETPGCRESAENQRLNRCRGFSAGLITIVEKKKTKKNETHELLRVSVSQNVLLFLCRSVLLCLSSFRLSLPGLDSVILINALSCKSTCKYEKHNRLQ